MVLSRAQLGEAAVYGEIADGRFYPLDGDPFAGPAPRAGAGVTLDGLTLLCPCVPRTTLLILGGFLKDGKPLPPGTVPRLTPKITSGVSGDGARIVVPRFVGTHLLMEVELAVVIGREVADASVEQAREAIFGYSCFNDASAPEFMLDMAAGKLLADPDYFRCKSIDTFASMGPWIDTSISERDLQDGIRLTAHVNGELKAAGNTRTAKFLPSEVVSHVSQATTLYPGDVIALGTPQACAAGPGDVVTLAIEGIGAFNNTIVAAA